MTKLQSNDCTVPKVILHLIDTTGPGGAETVFIQLADKIRDFGKHSIIVIRGSGWVEKELINRGLTPIIIPVKGSFAIGFLFKFIKLIKKNKVNIIQSHLLGSNVYAAIAGMLTRTPVVATYHGMVDVNPNERFKWLKHSVMKCGINSYVAVSQKLLDYIRELNLLDKKKTCVIYNGVDLKRYTTSKPVNLGTPDIFEETAPLRSSYNIPPDSILIGSLGNIRTAKAYDVLIDAGALLVKKYPKLHVFLLREQFFALNKGYLIT